jgi:hypothetical protein
MTGIGGPEDHKENVYKNQYYRNNKVDNGRQQDLTTRKRKLPVLG